MPVRYSENKIVHLTNTNVSKVNILKYLKRKMVISRYV